MSNPKFPGPFALAALELAAAGLAPLPTGGDDGKQPLISGFNRWGRPPSETTLRTWIEKFPTANIALACGPSRLVVVDVDDADLVPAMLDRFGPTPLQVGSPRTGAHLYYEGAVPGTTLRPALPVDIKSIGGIVLVPPSRRPETGATYTFRLGSFALRPELPPFRIGALGAGGTHQSPHRVPRGSRNDSLFRYLLGQAPACDDLETLVDVARTFNADALESPLADSEVLKTAHSAWRYQEDDRNWVGRRSRTVLEAELTEQLMADRHGGDALLLLTRLRASHARTGTSFALAPEAMAAAGVMPTWTAWRYRRAKAVLLACGELIVERRAKRRRNGRFEPHLFRLRSPS